MKRACLLCLPAAMLVCLALIGCNDESKPAFTRLNVTPACGVVPLTVEGYAVVSGGNETGDPTGSNNNLDIKWDFGDGHTSSTTISYNEYLEPGEYTVTVRATDPDGNTASANTMVRVMADSLMVEAFSDHPSGAATTADTIQFFVRAESCDIDPDVPGDSVKMVYKWDMGTGRMVGEEYVNYTYALQTPRFRFFEAGEYDVSLAVTYPAWAVTRHDTLHFTITDPAP